MSYTPLKVRYGTAVEPWHTLSLFYHHDTPMPRQRDRTRSSRALSGLGQATPGGCYRDLDIAIQYLDALRRGDTALASQTLRAIHGVIQYENGASFEISIADALSDIRHKFLLAFPAFAAAFDSAHDPSPL